MRSILLIFGIAAGLINTLMVGRYGFVTSDTAIDGAIAAFYFGIISLGAIGGPASSTASGRWPVAATKRRLRGLKRVMAQEMIGRSWPG
jgi:hypothetical protein